MWTIVYTSPTGRRLKFRNKQRAVVAYATRAKADEVASWLARQELGWNNMMHEVRAAIAAATGGR